FNLINKSGVPNFLIRTNFIHDHQLCFSDAVKIYSAFLFMVNALNRIDQAPYIKEAIYFYRRRNAPIKKPSLRQTSVKEKLSDFLSVYLYLKKEYSDPLVNYYLDKKLLNFYRKDIVALFNQAADINAYFEKLSTAAKQINHDHLD